MLSDILADAALDLKSEAEHYAKHDIYDQEQIDWVQNLARYLMLCAGAIQEDQILPSHIPNIPEPVDTDFAGPQLERFNLREER